MALSNILNEPRKEIKETLVGFGLLLQWTLIIGGVWFTISAISYFCIVVQLDYDARFSFARFSFAFILTPLGVALLIGFLNFVHKIGEDYLKKH